MILQIPLFVVSCPKENTPCSSFGEASEQFCLFNHTSFASQCFINNLHMQLMPLKYLDCGVDIISFSFFAFVNFFAHKYVYVQNSIQSDTNASG